MENQYSMIGTGFQIVTSLIIACTAAVYDYRKFKIPNQLTYSAMILGLLWHSLSPFGQGIAPSLGGLAIGFLCLVPFFIMGGMGAGDVKLLMAIGSVLGIRPTIVVVLASALSTGFYAVYVMVSQKCVSVTLDRLRLICHRFIVFGQHLAVDDHHRLEARGTETNATTNLIPFGVMVAFGMICFFAIALTAKLH